MSKNDKTDKEAIPYNADAEVLEKILDELKNAGSEGVNLKTLWANIDESKNANRSYTLTLAKFLNLVDTDGAKAWLTPLGNQIRLYSGDKRKRILIQKLPPTYLTMAKWIKFSPTEMAVTDLKAKYIEVFGNIKSTAIFDRAISTFILYCRHIGLLNFFGKGKNSSVALTDFGKAAIDEPADSEGTSTQSSGLTSPPPPPKEPELLKGNYPIRIVTKDRVFDWDIKSETDLAVIDSVVTSIKAGWQASHSRTKEDNKSE